MKLPNFATAKQWVTLPSFATSEAVGDASELCNQPLAGVELGVFAGDECREAAVTDERGMVYMTIPGDEPCELTFCVSDGNSQSSILNSQLTYETDAVVGSPRAPFIINLSEVTSVQYVALPTQQTEQVYDLQGRKLENGKLRKGIYNVNGQKKVK